jgi:hypothetical protein
MPDQVRHDEERALDGRWRRALARFGRAEEALGVVAHTEVDAVYDRALGRHGAALERLLGTPAPDLGAVSLKLELILRHSVFESSFADACFTVLQEDVRRFANVSAPPAAFDRRQSP